MLHQATDAYQRARRTTASPRELEASLLLAAAASLQAAGCRPVTDPERRDELSRAMTFNCKIWTVLVTSSMRTDSPVPASIRQSVAELGLFVIDRTAKAFQDADALSLADVGVLVDINRRIAAGLRG